MIQRAIVVLISCLLLSACHQELVSPHDPACSPALQRCDADGDGVYTPEDCNDRDASSYPGAAEVPYDGIDQDCSGADQNDFDGDGSSSTLAGGTDCDDQDTSIYPGALEVCDGVDNNCNGVVDTDAADRTAYHADRDDDGFGDPDSSIMVCDPLPDYVADDNDCDDQNGAINPDALESCDGVDDNCDGQIDEDVLITYYQDADLDGHGSPQTTTQACTLPSGYVTDDTDCNDASLAVHPGVTETCNSIDDNCDGQVDEGFLTSWYQDSDSDGYGSPASSTQTCIQPVGYVADSTDCDDTTSAVSPGTSESVCNGIDDNCNGLADDHPDLDGDGYDQCDPSVKGADSRPVDCDDTSPSVYPGDSAIVCNGIDDGCSGMVSDHPDVDGDGYDICPVGVQGADNKPVDCDDTESAIYPGAYDVIGDNIDGNCNGMIDQTFVFAGTGVGGFSGDGGPATLAELDRPNYLAIDAKGNLFMDTGNRVREVSNGIITTVAGNGKWGSSAEGVPATTVGLSVPYGIAFDALGNLYIAEDSDPGRIRKVDPYGITSILVTVSGPVAVAVDASGHVFEGGGDQVVRQIDGVGESEIIAGSIDTSGSAGDEGPALNALFEYPQGLVFSLDGFLFISDTGGCRVRYIDAGGIIHAYAAPEQHAGDCALTGDGSPATSSDVRLYFPQQLAFDNKGNLFIADSNNSVVRRVDATTDHIISTVVGGGTSNSSNISATTITLVEPYGVVLDAQGNLYVSDSVTNMVWKIIP